MPHIIRLRGPWECQALARWTMGEGGQWQLTTEGLPTSGTIELPGHWGEVLGADFSGKATFRRRFHKPTGLGERSRVWVAVEAVDERAEVVVNGAELVEAEAEQCPARFEIGALLRAQNELVITVTSRPGKGDGLGLVRLEIEEENG